MGSAAEERPSAISNARDEKDGKEDHIKSKQYKYNAIREQMEFYFGDANLARDQFLRKLIDRDPYVPLEKFLKFNKIKALTNSVKAIAQGVSQSQLLQLDETGLKVKRRTFIPAERNVDRKTLYVEALPPTADHDWVRQVFERFGEVVNVSLPTYAQSRKIKGFGFIEFKHMDSFHKAILAFNKFNGILKMQGTDPGELQSVRTLIIEQNGEIGTEEREDSDAEQKVVKRHKSSIEDAVHGGPEMKKAKTSDNGNESMATKTCDTTPNDAKKIRNDSNLSANAFFHELKILPKQDYKRLRNKYFNLHHGKQELEIKENPSYTKGLIVEVVFLKASANAKEFEAEMRQYETVKYFDVEEGAWHAYLSFDTAEEAADFVRHGSCAEYNCGLLSGEAEENYWKKIEAETKSNELEVATRNQLYSTIHCNRKKRSVKQKVRKQQTKPPKPQHLYR
ncbi:la-related protein 7-like [Eurosta solidaginis]|uniref:la-related protein 7-like n=1 Tax=Eurosta solidaginis TaxID=178769 RepID=UPI00353069A8